MPLRWLVVVSVTEYRGVLCASGDVARQTKGFGRPVLVRSGAHAEFLHTLDHILPVEERD